MDGALRIGPRMVGPGQACFVIAEAGVNHNGDLRLAERLVDAAADAGADAVKFQTFSAKRLVTKHAPKAAYQKQTTDKAESQREMLQRLELSLKMHRTLVKRCEQREVLFMSTPFDEPSADLLDELGVALFKIPSGEVTNLPYLEHLASKKKPLIVSTGMCNLAEVETAVETLEACNTHSFALLHCVSNYPAAASDVNLRAMDTLRTAFRVPIGYSDHTLGIEISLAAVARGANILEKHITLDRSMEGPDHRASIEPHELIELVRSVRNVEASLGTGRKRPVRSERDTTHVARKSLVAATDIPAGTRIDVAHLTTARPGTGLAPAMRPHILRRVTRRDIQAGTLLDLEMLR